MLERYSKEKIYITILFVFFGLACILNFQPVIALIEKVGGAKTLLKVIDGQSRTKNPFICLEDIQLDPQDKTIVTLARTDLQASLSRSPLLDQSFLMVGASYCLTDEKEKAVEVFQTYTSMKPEESWGQMQLFTVYSDLKRTDLIQKRLLDTKLNARELANFSQEIIEYYPDTDLLPYLQRAVELNPSDESVWNAWLQFGLRQEQNGQWTKALEIYQMAIKFQEKTTVRLLRGKFLLRIGRLYQTKIEPKNLKLALVYYNQALEDKELAPAVLSDTYLFMGEVYRALRPDYQPDQYLKVYLQAYLIYPKSYWASYALGSIYLYDFQDFTSAIKYLQIAISIDPKQPNGYLLLGDAYSKEGKMAQAVLNYGEALRLKPDWKEARNRLELIRGKNN